MGEVTWLIIWTKHFGKNGGNSYGNANTIEHNPNTPSEKM